MLHSIPAHRHGPHATAMTRAVEACVHCGFCLAACPTYRELGQEMDTPRGRIVLMKQVLEGGLPWSAAQTHVDRCLGCLACEPACPSGVAYRHLISPFRTLAQPRIARSRSERLRRWLIGQALPYPQRFRVALLAGRLFSKVRRFAPLSWRPMLELVPQTLPPLRRWPAVTPALGAGRARVALLLGCAQQVLAPDITSAALSVLARNGVEVIIPPSQGCCGALSWHTGDLTAARAFARQNLAAFPVDLDAILTTAAGCGSALREYSLILKDTAAEGRADDFCKRAMDISAFLAQLGLSELPLNSGRASRIVYHDACHLLHGQNVRQQPRALLQMIPGVTLCKLADPEICCGSAGTYNLDQPALAAALGQKKARALADSGADLVVTGNIGCMVQLQMHLERLGKPLPVRHTIQVLRDAYKAE